jgi:hypothetical protein
MEIIEQDEILQLAEKSRNAINDVAHLCSGEDEEHIFDMGFYSGFNLARETLYTEHQVREIIRKSQIRDEYGIFEYPNEDELLKK